MSANGNDDGSGKSNYDFSVTGVDVIDGRNVVANFSDGHMAIFCSKLPSGERKEPLLQKVTLYKDGDPVFLYYVQLGLSQLRESNRIAHLSPDYTQTRAAKYWGAVREHLYHNCYLPAIRSGEKPDDFRWQLVYYHGERDLASLMKGAAKRL